jgi:hypothetical protein
MNETHPLICTIRIIARNHLIEIGDANNKIYRMTHLSIRHLLTKAVERLVLIVFVFISVPLLYVVLALGVLIWARKFRLYLSSTRRRRPM